MCRAYAERVEYFFYCRDRPGTAALRDELIEAHRSFMDRYADAMIGGTMWDFEGGSGPQRALPHHRPRRGRRGSRRPLDDDQRRFVTERRRHFIACGPLLSDDGTNWVGSAMLVELRDRAAVEAMLAEAPYLRAGVYAGVEIHHWEFGGRRSA